MAFFSPHENVIMYSFSNTRDKFLAVCLTLQELLESSSDPESGGEEENAHGSVIDMEDLGTVMNHMKKAKVGAVFRSAPVGGWSLSKESRSLEMGLYNPHISQERVNDL